MTPSDGISLRFVAERDLKMLKGWLTKRRYQGRFGPLYEVQRAEFMNKWKKGKFGTWFVIESAANKPLGVLIYYRTPKDRSLSVDFRLYELRKDRVAVAEKALRLALGHLLAEHSEIDVLFAEADSADLEKSEALTGAGFERFKDVRSGAMVGPSRGFFRMSRARAETLYQTRFVPSVKTSGG